MRFIILFLLTLLPCLAETITGRVVSVADGDTITVLDADKVQHKIRLYGIDSPEKKQDFGERAKQAMSDMVYNKTVKVDVMDVDRYKRIVGRVYQGDTYVNLAMIQKGLAWWYKHYAKKDFDLRDAEEKAREDKVGLWSRSDAVAPWEFRKKRTRNTSN